MGREGAGRRDQRDKKLDSRAGECKVMGGGGMPREEGGPEGRETRCQERQETERGRRGLERKEELREEGGIRGQGEERME